MLEKHKLLITGDDLKHFKAMIASKNVITACPLGMVNTKWQFWKLTNVTFFPFLLKNIPMGCRNALLPDHRLKERFNNCLTCNQNTCDILTFFKSLAIQLHRDERSEERTCNDFNLYVKVKGKVRSATFQGVCLNDIQAAEETLGISISLYDVDTVDGYFVGELVRWSMRKYSSTDRLLRYTTVIFTM